MRLAISHHHRRGVVTCSFPLPHSSRTDANDANDSSGRQHSRTHANRLSYSGRTSLVIEASADFTCPRGRCCSCLGRYSSSPSASLRSSLHLAAVRNPVVRHVSSSSLPCLRIRPLCHRRAKRRQLPEVSSHHRVNRHPMVRFPFSRWKVLPCHPLSYHRRR